jgi:hypothetical protein
MTNSEREEWFDGMLIPAVEAYNVAGAFVTTKTGIDAKVITVKGMGEVTVDDYDGTDMAMPNVSDVSVDVLLDQVKSTSPVIERVDNFNSFIEAIPQVTEKTAQAVSKVIDTYTFATLATSPNIVPAVELDATNIVAFISAMGVKLDNLEAPVFGRKLALTAEASAFLVQAVGKLNSDSIATKAGNTGAIGNYGGFDIYKTVNLKDSVLTFGILNETDIPNDCTIVTGTVAAEDGTAVLTGSVLEVATAADNATATAARDAAKFHKYAIASVDSGTALGIGYNEARVVELEARFADSVQTLIKYGSKIVQEKFVVKADIS